MIKLQEFIKREFPGLTVTIVFPEKNLVYFVFQMMKRLREMKESGKIENIII